VTRNDKGNITIEDAQIAFRNFAGKEEKYNNEGDRNFAILLRPDDELKMISAGWNVKHLKVREEGDVAQAFIHCSISYKNRPPRIAMVTSRGLTYLGQDEIDMLDWVDIETADVTLNPYTWTVGDKSGVKAYVQSLFIKIAEDYLQEKWTDWAEGRRPSDEPTVVES
jgi:hypothetical protein